MKVLLVTLSDNENMGTFLQVHALGSVLQARGHRVELLNYTRRWSGLAGGIRERMAKSDQPLFRRLAATAYGIVDHLRVRRRMFRFLRSEIAVSRNYRDFESLAKSPPQADVYLTGSDQVWNSVYNHGVDRVMYLDFAPQDRPRVAYAASFGMDSVPGSEVEQTTRLLRKYRRISVRESSAKALIDGLGIEGAEHVLDPTLLLDLPQWSRFSERSKVDPSDPYVLIYSVEPNKNALALQVARRVADKLGCKVAMLTPNGFRKIIPGVDQAWTNIGPAEFVRLFLKAKFVVVSSFHGTAFSLNLNRPFLSIRPDKYVSRARDLLESCGLGERLIDDADFSDSLISTDVDFSATNAHFGNRRESSMSFLVNTIGDA